MESSDLSGQGTAPPAPPQEQSGATPDPSSAASAPGVEQSSAGDTGASSDAQSSSAASSSSGNGASSPEPATPPPPPAATPPQPDPEAGPPAPTQDELKAELDRLLEENLITQEEHDKGLAHIEDEANHPIINPSLNSTAEQVAQAAVTQATQEPVKTPDVADVSPEPARLPNLVIGQRVTTLPSHPSPGRMALVTNIIYTDPIQQMLAHMGAAESRFATVLQYVLVTRDGRSDTLVAKPEELKAIEENQGWGRGQF